MAKQPDLLDWQPPIDDAPSGAIIIPYPLDRDVGRVRRVAQVLLTKRSDKARTGYWNSSICRRLAAAMERNGITETEIGLQLDAFRSAVSNEMHRIVDGDRRSPGGAA